MASKLSHHIFQLLLKSMIDTMGENGVKSLFLSSGMDIGKDFARKIKETINTDKNNDLLELSRLFKKEFLDYNIEAHNSKIQEINGTNTVTISLAECPLKKAGFNIKNGVYCTYTQGLLKAFFEEFYRNIKKVRIIKNYTQAENNSKECCFEITINDIETS